MKRSAPLQRRTPPKARRQRPPTPEFWQQQRAALSVRSGGRCEASITAECAQAGHDLNRTGMQAHHRKLRSQGGGHGLVNLVGLCPACHRWVHDHPEQARLRGLICPRLHDPASWALTLPDGRIVTLNTDGGYDLLMSPGVA